MEKFEKLTKREEVLDIRRGMINALQSLREDGSNSREVYHEFENLAFRLEYTVKELKWYEYLTVGLKLLHAQSMVYKYLPLIKYMADVENKNKNKQYEEKDCY